MSIQNPVIVIPGITATELLDDYPFRTEDIWTMVFNKEYERIALHPDNLRYEALEPAHVLPGRAFSIYNDLIKALRHELSLQADKPTPVFAFPYDWRIDLKITAGLLEKFVKEVIARTKLLKHYARAEDLKVDLVGHSMGGLIICEYLSLAGSKAKIGRVATIGTPFLGCIESVVQIATGMSLLAGDVPREREREAARVTPAVYQLFPSYSNAAITGDGRHVDLYDPVNVQGSVLASLTEFVRLYSVNTPSAKRRAKAAELLKHLLSRGKDHRSMVTNLQLSKSGLRQADWLALIGVGQHTRTQITVDRIKDQSRYIIDDTQFINELTSTNSGSHRTGDGTVPLEGAVPPFLAGSRPVCVTESDLGFFEARDRQLVEFGGFHGLLPRVNLVQRLIVSHLRSRTLGDVWGRRLPGARTWNPPVRGLKEKSY